ncbi:MAG: hypothetical protein HKN58_08485 [Xanthomonadales bacterium]|nr:hypothetical protein [Xanthomonadales bacterium]
MHRSACTIRRITRTGRYTALLLCLLPVLAAAQASGLPGDDALRSPAPEFRPVIFPQAAPALPFDLAGSETRKLQLQLSEPLSFQAAGESRWLNAGSGSLLAGSALEWTVTDRLKLGAALNSQRSRVQFQPLGSIHCENGVLQAGSYRASGCYFTNNPATLDQDSMNLSADFGLGDSAQARFSLFREESSANAQGLLPGSVGPAPLLGPALAGSAPQGFLFPGARGATALDHLDSELSGIDLEFKLGVSTDRAGDMQLGLQFTRILDGQFDGSYLLGDDALQWTLAEPVDSAAVRFDWQRNSFSGGIQGFYREPVEFLNRDNAAGLTTFDVYFTWRTPWNASLSVGASNLLNSGVDDKASRENTIKDPFEAVYGRIPYVRYQQDL